MANYRLLSTPMVSTPGLVAWAMNGYAFPRDRAKLSAVFVDGYGLPRAAAKALLSGAVPFTVEGETAVFTYPAPRLTQAKVKAELAARDITFRRTDYGEFRVNLKGAGEGPAAYESDLQSALDTGLAMAAVRDAATSIPYRPFFPPTGARKAAAFHGLDSFRHGCPA